MQFSASRALFAAFVSIALTSVSARAAESFAFSDIAGWWSAEPQFAGESSRVLLHFQEEQGKQIVRLSLLGIGGYDVPVGTVAISGDSLDMQPLPFPLKYDAAKGTLSGYLPEAAVPVYKIPVEFRRIEALAKPAAPTWNFPQPRVKWRFDVKGPVWAGLEYDARSGRLFVGTDSGTVYAIDTANAGKGAAAWTFDTGKAIKARPAAIGDSVYVASDSGFLYKLDKRTGAERWRAKIDAGSPARIPASDEKSRWDRYGSSAIVDGSRLYVGSRDNSLYALDVATGKELWRIAARDMMTATPTIYRDLLLFADFAGKVQAVDARNGKPRWTYDAKLPVAGDLVVAGDRVFVGSRTYDLIALDAATGKELWKHYYWFSWIESPPVVRDQVVYTGSSDGVGVFAINVKDGSLRWKTKVPGWAWARTAVDDHVVVAGTVGLGAYPGVRSGSLVGIERSSGTVRWMYVEPPTPEQIGKKTEWGFASAPIIAGATVYAADLNGRVYAIETG